MTALTKDRNTLERDAKHFVDPVAAGAVIHAGALVCLDSAGNLVPGSVSTTLKARGRAEDSIDNSAGSAGDVELLSRKGVFQFENAGDITSAQIETDVYINDDQTVSSVATGKSIAGRCLAVNADGVWVEIR